MWAEIDCVRSASVGFNGDATLGGGAVSANAATNEEGAWTDIVASTDHDAQGFILLVGGDTAAYGLLDIALGTTDEDEILSDVLVDFTRVTQLWYSLYFPIPIPSGTGISARLRSPTTAANITVRLCLIDAPISNERYLNTCETIGVDTNTGVGASSGRNDSGGSTVNPGTTPNTFGSWKELSAGTTYPFRHALLMIGYLQNTVSSAMHWRIQVGIGAAGNEEVVWDGLMMTSNTATDRPYPFYWSNPLVGAAGSRVCVRASCSGSDANDVLFQAAMYLFRDGS